MKKTILLTLFLLSLVILILRFGNQFLNPSSGQKAGIKVLSSLEGEVFINDVKVGKTPFIDNDLLNQEYTIQILADGAKWEGKIKLTAGSVTIINRDLSKDVTSSAGEILTLEKGTGVTLISSPAGADVKIDNKDYPKTPTHIDISAGDHVFEISKGSFLKRSISATVPADYNLTLNVDLALSEADLTNITAPAITETPKLIVKNTPTGFLRVRDKPSIIGKEVTQVKPGDELILLEEQASWDRIRTSDNKEGYVSSVYVTKKTK